MSYGTVAVRRQQFCLVTMYPVADFADTAVDAATGKLRWEWHCLGTRSQGGRYKHERNWRLSQQHLVHRQISIWKICAREPRFRVQRVPILTAVASSQVGRTELTTIGREGFLGSIAQ